jgi:hypothetical protein
MHTIAIKLHAENLANPDLDIRYVLPDLLKERSGGIISDDGYDYVGDDNDLVLFLKVTDLERAVACINHVLTGDHVLGNDLRAGAIVAVEHEDGYRIIYPPGCRDEFRV